MLYKIENIFNNKSIIINTDGTITDYLTGINIQEHPELKTILKPKQYIYYCIEPTTEEQGEFIKIGRGRPKITNLTREEYSKQYYLNNVKPYKEKMERRRCISNLHYKINKKLLDDIKETKLDKIDCVCGRTYTYKNRIRHFKTELHSNGLMSQLNKT